MHYTRSSRGFSLSPSEGYTAIKLSSSRMSGACVWRPAPQPFALMGLRRIGGHR